MGAPDYVFDPDDWESTYDWESRCELTIDVEYILFEPKKYSTLIEGPPKWAKTVILARDEDGNPDETELRWFDSIEDALAADCPKVAP